jgi:hypothetical protein
MPLHAVYLVDLCDCGRCCCLPLHNLPKCIQLVDEMAAMILFRLVLSFGTSTVEIRIRESLRQSSRLVFVVGSLLSLSEM